MKEGWGQDQEAQTVQNKSLSNNSSDLASWRLLAFPDSLTPKSSWRWFPLAPLALVEASIFPRHSLKAGLLV